MSELPPFEPPAPTRTEATNDELFDQLNRAVEMVHRATARAADCANEFEEAYSFACAGYAQARDEALFDLISLWQSNTARVRFMVWVDPTYAAPIAPVLTAYQVADYIDVQNPAADGEKENQ